MSAAPAAYLSGGNISTEKLISSAAYGSGGLQSSHLQLQSSH
jgi:hypothetical protein